MDLRRGFLSGAAPTLLAGALALAGCGGAKRATPDACIRAFDAAMRGGDTGKAAALFAYDQWSADNSTDWDTYARGQREAICGKLREAKAAQLQAWRAAYLQASYQPALASIAGEWAQLALSGPRGSIPVRLRQSEGEWLIYSIGALQAGQ
ncbi:MAG: hypothetical protein HY321_18170 [Armatimonadetes bacterium]|nr:hypothetical protein [Armatimonadota bacterium]